ncbi:inter-alpha-trypsin inhibitor heavy chain H1-like isoform X2 [Rhynchophorus ferrugineus]|uniref:inter-alpha-trypsin inhibitor heavy chain H1-like isoform X2 n=1 Tax=Rhynchophorus ferrugineus TaxID=354439 RepID=UPI003FCD767F
MHCDSIDDWVLIERPPKLLSSLIKTRIVNRFAKTVVTNKLHNDTNKEQEVTFCVVIPEEALISGFTFEIDGKQYVSEVKRKEYAEGLLVEDEQDYNGIEHVTEYTRQSGRFIISADVQPGSVVTFCVTYEEFLNRINEKYELILNVTPGQFVEDFVLSVNIDEQVPIKFVKVPNMRSGNGYLKEDSNLDPEASITVLSRSGAEIEFKPDIEKQKSLSKYLSTDEGVMGGLIGQFVVQYDLAKDEEGGEVFIDENGYFLHFFAPTLPPLKKQVIFTLDVSGSMCDKKFELMKEAMVNILNTLKPDDCFSIIQFNNTISLWDLIPGEVVLQKSIDRGMDSEDVELCFRAVPGIISNALNLLENLKPSGGTNILDALKRGLEITKAKANEVFQPIIVLLTDGEPTVGQTNTTIILSEITRINVDKVPIFGLTFGDKCDREFLERLSIRNCGISKHIYEGVGVPTQLEEFYKGFSSPLIRNVHFIYINNEHTDTRITFPVLFKGRELFVNGIGGEGFQAPAVVGLVDSGVRKLRTRIIMVSTSLERVWAFLTIKSLLQDDKANVNAELKEAASQLAMNYSFLTEVTPFVLAKPDSILIFDAEDMSKSKHFPRFGPILELKSVSRNTEDVLNPLMSERGVQIDQVSIEPTALNCYEITKVKFSVVNSDATNEALSNLPLILPIGAVITGGFIEVGNHKYMTYIQPKYTALSLLHHAKINLKEACFICLTDEPQNKYMITIYLPPSTRAVVQIGYERLIPRINGKFHLEFNILPELIGDVVVASVTVNTLRPVISAEVTGDLEVTEMKIRPTRTKFCFYQGILKEEVLKDFPNGPKFGVRYDFEHDPFNGEVMIDDGYFTFPFEPVDIPSFKKHVVFVLDTTSAPGNVRSYFKKLLSRLEPEDQFTIIHSGGEISIWDVETSRISFQRSQYNSPNNQVIPQPIKATKKNMKRAKMLVDIFKTVPESDIELTLDVALKSVNGNKSAVNKPVIILIKNIEPGMTRIEEEQMNRITSLNKSRIPMFALIEGEYRPSFMIQKLCANNKGYAKRLFNILDSDQQINDFYNHILVALRLNLTFREHTSTIDFIGVLPPYIPVPTLYTRRELYTAVELIRKEMKQRLASSSSARISGLEFKYSVVTDITAFIMARL